MTCKLACTPAATAIATATPSQKKQGDWKRSEQNKVVCGDCPHGDNDCKTTCVTKEVVKEIDVCTSCTKAPAHKPTPSGMFPLAHT